MKPNLKVVGYRDAAPVEDEPWREPVGPLARCPFCGAGRDTASSYGVSNEDGACGPTASWWTRLWRWCWRRDAHLHQECTACEGRWVVLAADRAKLAP